MRSAALAVAFACLSSVPHQVFAEYRCPGGHGAPCPVFNPDNGHYYAKFDRVPSWDAARAAAETYTFLGARGHLATTASAEEEAFLIQSGLNDGGAYWIGASDEALEGEWRWVTGPEAGELFWVGGVEGHAVTHSNWKVGAPNDNQDFGGQDYGRLEANLWNDSEPNYPAGAIIEFSVPEPSSLALLALGVVGIVAWRRMVRR